MAKCTRGGAVGANQIIAILTRGEAVRACQSPAVRAINFLWLGIVPLTLTGIRPSATGASVVAQGANWRSVCGAQFKGRALAAIHQRRAVGRPRLGVFVLVEYLVAEHTGAVFAEFLAAVARD